MIIKEMNIKDLRPADYNPRKDLTPDDPEYIKLKRSIMTYGYIEPIVFNERTGTIVGGHQRLKILEDLGYNEVTVSVIDVSEEEEKALNIALNKIEGDWDNARLKDLLEELDTGAFDIELTGFDFSEIENLMTQFHPDDKEEEFEDVGGEVGETYEVIIECDSEDMQQQMYNRLTKEGYTCRVLTL